MMKKTKTKLTFKQTKSLFFVLLLFLRNGIISKVKNYNINVAFLPVFLLFFGSLGAQTIRVLDVQPTASRGAGAVQSYNLGGSYMTNAKAKLACTNLFGISGTVTHPITVTTAAGTLGSINAALLANYDVVFMAALVEGFATNYYTPAEIDALKVWSRDPHHVIISAEQQMNQYFTNSMGLSIINGNTDPTTVDAGGIDSTTTKLFSGIFGTPTSAGISQGGSAQGYFTAPCGVWSVAKNAVGNSTIVINNYNDVLLGDGDFFSIISTTGGVSSGCGINSNTDKVWLNLWAWAADQVINGSSSSSYISSAVPPTLTLLNPMPTSSTNTGQIQSTIPTGYTLVGWQTSTDSGSTWTSLGSTANPYTYTNAANGQMYQAIWSGGSGCPNTYSNILTITISRCVNGCNPNTFVNSSDPNTIEYDNVVSAVTTLAKTDNGTFTIWGQGASPAGGSLLAPTAITPANGYSYTGTPLKATTGSFVDYSTPGFIYYYAQSALLTTNGLYLWGSPNRLVSSSIKNTAAFGKITVNGKADGLPAGVTPNDVKMMFGSHQTLGIVTCSGDAWVLSFGGSKNGDGTVQNAANNVIWHRVKTSATTDLNGVVAMRGNALALFALTSDGKLYTWGTGTYLGDGTAAANRTYATEVVVPAGVTPKTIGMTMGTATSQPYYLLATDGRLFSMGENSSRQLGDGTTADKTTWVQPQKMTDQYGQGTGPLVNIAWISPNEHTADNDTNTKAGINVLTNDKKLWGWGLGRLIGGTSFTTYYDPVYMPGNSTNANGMKVTDEIIMVETGGDYALNYKKNSDKFGFVGLSVYNKGDGSNTIQVVPVYAYDTAVLMTCGAEIGPAVQDLQVCNGTTANLNNANLAATPSEVEWHATNDASSPVITNITAVAPGTYYAFYTVASGKQRVAGSAAIVTGVVCCSTGNCNPNTFVNAVDPNTIEYDNMVSTYHSTIIKEGNGAFKVWGQATAPNGTSDLLSPTAITPANGFNYTGTPLRATGGSYVSGNSYQQFALLTTDGLYIWGDTNRLISSAIKNTSAFGKVTINGKADGLPPGVIPGQVKMLFGSYGTLAITTCSGEAWVLSMTGAKNGDGTPQDATNNVIWHRVKTAAAGNPTLDNVVAMRGAVNALFALTSDGSLYTWGTNTYINSGAAANRTYATQISIPVGVTPKMIGMTPEGTTTQSYYLLATNGKLYGMGANFDKQLGDGTTTVRTTWVQPQKMTNQSGQGTGPLENIAWISPNEHEGNNLPIMNVLTNNNKQWAWGLNDNYMIGGVTNNAFYDPIYMPGTSAAANGLKVTDELIALETGGHTTMNIKKGESKFGYVGHRTNGSMGDGSTANEIIPAYSYNTAIVTVCGADTSSLCYKPGITAGTALDTKVGITALSRAGLNSDNWPMVRKGGWLALESKTKGFVPNRVAFSGANPVGIAPANFVEGMMVYDTTNKCMKMYTSQDNGVTFGWYCITTPTCPD